MGQPCEFYLPRSHRRPSIGPAKSELSIYRPGRPGRLSALSVYHSKSVLCGVFLWARGAKRPETVAVGRGSAPTMTTVRTSLAARTAPAAKPLDQRMVWVCASMLLWRILTKLHIPPRGERRRTTGPAWCAQVRLHRRRRVHRGLPLPPFRLSFLRWTQEAWTSSNGPWTGSIADYGFSTLVCMRVS